MKSQFSRWFPAIAGMILAAMMLLLGRDIARADDAQWYGQIWSNRSFNGAPTVQRWENTIDFRWGNAAPDPRVPNENFSIRWVKKQYFSGGTYRFKATMDDAMRVWVDGRMVMDYWWDSQGHTETVDVALSAGDHDIRIDYYDAGGVAVAQFSWQQIATGPGNTVTTPTTFNNWKGEYFNNVTLSGTPSLVRDDRYINFDWGVGSPDPKIFADYFSARWTKTYQSVVPGLYKFSAQSDDGMRIWVNGELIFNNWKDQAAGYRTGEYWSNGGPTTVVVEYYEAVGGAMAKVSFLQVPNGFDPNQGIPGGTNPPATGNCAYQPSGLEAVVVNATTLNVRSAPNTNASVIGRLSSCDRVALVGYRNPDSTWVMVWYKPGVAGWASATYLKLGVPMNQLSPANQ